MSAQQSIETAWESVDPLGEALHSLRMSGTFYARSELTAPWGIELPAMPGCLMFHVVTDGEVLGRKCLGRTAAAQGRVTSPSSPMAAAIS